LDKRVSFPYKKMELASKPLRCTFRNNKAGANNLQSVEAVTQYRTVKNLMSLLVPRLPYL